MCARWSRRVFISFDRLDALAHEASLESFVWTAPVVYVGFQKEQAGMFPVVDPHASNAIHESLRAWLVQAHPHAPAGAILAALTYEVGRVCGALVDGASQAEVDIMLDAVCDVMREQINAYRSGRLKE